MSRQRKAGAEHERTTDDRDESLESHGPYSDFVVRTNLVTWRSLR
jgi:hypothetical protein